MKCHACRHEVTDQVHADNLAMVSKLDDELFAGLERALDANGRSAADDEKDEVGNVAFCQNCLLMTLLKVRRQIKARKP